MASYLKPRRGAYSAISSTVLQSGEIFFETPNGVGGGKGRIMMGNASNTYAQLAGSSKYFLDIDSTPVAYSNITGSVGSSADNYSALAASLGSGTVTLPTLTRVLKRALYDLRATIIKLNSDISGKVPTSRTVNSKALSSNITLSASDVGALKSFVSVTAANCKPSAYAYALVTFQDKSINSQYFTRFYKVTSERLFKDSITLAANSNLYVENIEISFSSASGAVIGNCYFSPVVGPAFQSATKVVITEILAIPV